jgi:hypothetical protein
MAVQSAPRGRGIPDRTDFSHIDDTNWVPIAQQGDKDYAALSVPQMRLRRGHGALSLLVSPPSGNRTIVFGL